MENAHTLIKEYVEAGFTKIHLDCSEGCAGEAPRVDDTMSSRRSAELAAVCESSAPDRSRLTYVIGTEVPPPGGAKWEDCGTAIEPTSAKRAQRTIDCHKKAFRDAGIEDAWTRVVALVVQPGLEFSATHISRFDVTMPNGLSAALAQDPGICFEAHSTDYQFDNVFPNLAQRNFAFLKVGPALTFAYRAAIYSLDLARRQIFPDHSGHEVQNVMERLMIENSTHWKNHYSGDDQSLRLQRHFGYADRIRYYWPEPDALDAVASLFLDLAETQPPIPMLQQLFDGKVVQAFQQFNSAGGSWAERIVRANVQAVLAPYFVGEV